MLVIKGKDKFLFYVIGSTSIRLAQGGVQWGVTLIDD
jgi:hypothetical protein